MTLSQTDRQKLVEDGQGMVYSLASQIHRNIPMRVDFEDLVAYGEVGLSQAARDFNPDMGNQFSTFAWFRIRGAIYDGISKMSWTGRARFRRARFRQMANEVLADDARTGSSFSSVEEGAEWFRDITGKLTVVYLATQGESGGKEIEDDGETASTVVARQEVFDRLHILIEALPEQAKRLVQLIYYDGVTLHQAAGRLGISKSWASRIHAKILEQLARSLRSINAE